MKCFGLDIRRARRVTQEIEAPLVRDRVQRLEIELAELKQRHDVLQGHFEKLRGFVHGTWQQKARTPGQQAIPFGDKRALRRAFGLLRDAPSQEEQQHEEG